MKFMINVSEEQILPEEKFLLIDSLYDFEFPKCINELKRERYSKKSDEEFELIKQEFESFLRENENPNLISVGMYKSYADINLPKTYDVIFDIRNKSRFWYQKTIVKYAYNYKDIFHTDLWQGHSSHLIIEIIGKPPIIFNELNINYKDTNKTCIGLCNKFDWEFIKQKNNNA
ncbi:hypothetical protein C3729_01900 [Cloacibacterium normanense]|uniref:Uncharacterized protein n=1 Tax=Cloacibacterium normanense TaxID=237258 RepID=A0A2S7I896_9FLAO|nr:hypothetical protein [Cloacibacterium normanense]PPZ92784.1 hypothetical protein C3729_01900 [Cloacibacterium normanense]